MKNVIKNTKNIEDLPRGKCNIDKKFMLPFGWYVNDGFIVLLSERNKVVHVEYGSCGEGHEILWINILSLMHLYSPDALDIVYYSNHRKTLLLPRDDGQFRNLSYHVRDEDNTSDYMQVIDDALIRAEDKRVILFIDATYQVHLEFASFLENISEYAGKYSNFYVVYYTYATTDDKFYEMKKFATSRVDIRNYNHDLEYTEYPYSENALKATARSIVGISKVVDSFVEETRPGELFFSMVRQCAVVEKSIFDYDLFSYKGNSLLVPLGFSSKETPYSIVSLDGASKRNLYIGSKRHVNMDRLLQTTFAAMLHMYKPTSLSIVYCDYSESTIEPFKHGGVYPINLLYKGLGLNLDNAESYAQAAIKFIETELRSFLNRSPWKVLCVFDTCFTSGIVPKSFSDTLCSLQELYPNFHYVLVDRCVNCCAFSNAARGIDAYKCIEVGCYIDHDRYDTFRVNVKAPYMHTVTTTPRFMLPSEIAEVTYKVINAGPDQSKISRITFEDYAVSDSAEYYIEHKDEITVDGVEDVEESTAKAEISEAVVKESIRVSKTMLNITNPEKLVANDAWNVLCSITDNLIVKGVELPKTIVDTMVTEGLEKKDLIVALRKYIDKGDWHD